MHYRDGCFFIVPSRFNFITVVVQKEITTLILLLYKQYNYILRALGIVACKVSYTVLQHCSHFVAT